MENCNWEKFADDPYPGWGNNRFTLFGLPNGDLRDENSCNDLGIFSIPFDSTAFTRNGSRYGPAAIRQASLSLSSQLSNRGNVILRNMRDNQVYQPRKIKAVDYGDLHVYPVEMERQVAASIAEVYRISMMNVKTLMLGGEHTLTYPSFMGVALANQQKGKSVGYVQIDNHFDFGDSSSLHGKYFQGSNARRIADEKIIPASAIGFYGVGDLTRQDQFTGLIQDGYKIVPIFQIHAEGVNKSLRRLLDSICANVDLLYVSIDIDVCDASAAPGTGSNTIGGLNSFDFMSIASIIKQYPLAGLDIMEVSPIYDPTQRTAMLVSRFLFEWIFLEEISSLT